MLSRPIGAAGGIALILIVSLAVALVATRPPSPLAAAQRLFEAVAFRFLGPLHPPDPNVVVVGITEETLAGFPYRSPIDRAFLAGVIDALAQKGVAAVGLDIVLDRPTEPAKDAALRRALTRSDIPVLAISIAPDTSMPADRRRFLEAFLTGVQTGDANLARDRFDDVVRDHVPLHPATGLRSFPAAIAAALGAPVPDRMFPIEWRRSGRLPHAGPDVPIYPAEAIRLLPPGWLKGKVALIGSLVAGSDEHRTLASTFGQPSFGVEIHAQVVSQLLNRRAIPEPSVPWPIIVATAGLAAGGVTLGIALVGYFAAAALALLGIVFVAAVLAAYASTGTLLPVVAPLVALALAGGAARAWRGGTDRRDRRALRALFSRFVSEPVVNEIMKDRDLFMAGGRPVPRELTATVLYADVAGFTTICEGLEPAPLIAWLDRYIDTMAALIMQHDGVLLRFIGDGILAVFGVPIPRLDETAIATDARDGGSERRVVRGRPAGGWPPCRRAYRSDGGGQPGQGRADGVLPAGRHGECRGAPGTARQAICRTRPALLHDRGRRADMVAPVWRVSRDPHRRGRAARPAHSHGGVSDRFGGGAACGRRQRSVCDRLSSAALSRIVMNPLLTSR
jgi:adenylate cyclase